MMSKRKENNAAPGRGRVALITGAAAGIGRACAELFAERGYRVALADRDEDRLDTAMSAIVKKGGDAMALPLDIADPDACEAAADRMVRTWGRIDAFVANAGIQVGGTLLETPDHDWQRILGVNLNGTAYSVRAVIPPMLDHGSGAIVIVSSVNALVGTAGMAVYDMSKAAVLGLSRSLAAEYGTRGIRVNAVCPGNTLTDFHLDAMACRGISADEVREMTRGYGLLGRIAEPREIAQAIAFLAGDDASFITGQALVVDGGFCVAGARG
jgi:meso-butanediol dehydrogenase/(S,S)-butanediol dehydrogenase/diacetyl reductase